MSFEYYSLLAIALYFLISMLILVRWNIAVRKEDRYRRFLSSSLNQHILAVAACAIGTRWIKHTFFPESDVEAHSS